VYVCASLFILSLCFWLNRSLELKGSHNTHTRTHLPTENTCAAKADGAAWQALGCVVSTDATATTVTGLGAQSAYTTTHTSCAITCPMDGAAFLVVAAGAHFAVCGASLDC
jgi:hypothetical protein